MNDFITDRLNEFGRENPTGMIFILMVLVTFMVGRAICWVVCKMKNEKLGKLTFDKTMKYLGYGMIPVAIFFNQWFLEEGIEIKSNKNTHIESNSKEKGLEGDIEYWKAYYEEYWNVYYEEYWNAYYKEYYKLE